MPAASRTDVFDACPITPVVDLIFARWTAPILWSLNQNGKQRFTQLEHNLPGVTPKVLTQRLRQLELDGLVERTYYTEMPPRVEYTATPLAQSLAPVFEALIKWSVEHLGEVHASRMT